MKSNASAAPASSGFTAWVAAALVATLAVAGIAIMPTNASAAAVAVPLGTAGNFAVLAGSTVTNTGPTTIGGSGDLGVYPGSAVTGFPPGIVDAPGTIETENGVVQQAQADLTTGYDNAAAQPITATIPVELGGSTLTSGVYTSPGGTFGMTGPLTLNAQGNPDAVFIFKASSTLITASASSVNLINGAQACNVFWQVGSSATIGSNSSFVGSILALTSITVNSGATIAGRALARNAEVSLIDDTIVRPTCTSGGTTGGITSGLIGGVTTGGTTSGLIGGVTTGGTTAGTTGGTTSGLLGGVIGGVTTGGTTSGLLGGVIGGVTPGGTTGGLLGGLLGGVTGGTTGGTTAGTTGGTIGGTTGGETGGTTGGYCDHGCSPCDHGCKPCDHGCNPCDHGCKPCDHQCAPQPWAHDMASS